MSYVDPANAGTPQSGQRISTTWGKDVQTDAENAHTILGTVVWLADPQFGAHLDGVTDDSAAFAAAVAATPSGGTLVLPPKPILLSSNQVVTAGITIKGSGCWNALNQAFGTWGTLGQYYGTYYSGTILYFSSTTGTALTLGPASTFGDMPAGPVIRDLMLLGPGTGTGTGLSLRNMAQPEFGANVQVANFYNGIITNNIQSGHAGSFKAYGCGNVGINLTNATNNVVFDGWGVGSASGVALELSGSSGIYLTAFECQDNTGTLVSFSSACADVVIGAGSWFENASATAGILINNSSTVTLQQTYHGTAADSVTLSSGLLKLIDIYSPTAVVTNNGALMYVLGPGPSNITTTGGGSTYTMFAFGVTNNLQTGVAIPAGQYIQLNGPSDTTSAIHRDTGTGDTQINAGSGLTHVLSSLKVDGGTVLNAGAFVSGDKYLVVDASGNVHKSATGPAS